MKHHNPVDYQAQVHGDLTLLCAAPYFEVLVAGLPRLPILCTLKAIEHSSSIELIHEIRNDKSTSLLSRAMFRVTLPASSKNLRYPTSDISLSLYPR